MFPLQSVTIAVSHVFSRAIPLAYLLFHDMENMPVRVRGIRHGNELWREWCTIVRFDSAAVVSLFDQHGVVDCLTHSVACDVGTDLEHLAGVRNLLCSYGHKHCHHALDKSQAWAPMVYSFDGQVFTSYNVGLHRHVDVSRDPGHLLTAIRIRGDKTAISNLLGKPAILFDDKVDNVNLHLANSFHGSEAFLVDIGGRRRCRMQGYAYSNNPRCWPDQVQCFVDRHASFAAW